MPTHALHTHVSQSVHGVCVNVYTRDENGSCAGLNARSRAYHKCIYVVATTQSHAYRRHTDNKKHQPAASRQSKRIHRRHARLGNAHQPLCLCFISEIYDCLRRSDNYYGERARSRKRDMRARLWEDVCCSPVCMTNNTQDIGTPIKEESRPAVSGTTNMETNEK